MWSRRSAPSWWLAPLHHRCQAAAVAPDRIGWVDLIALLHASGMLGVIHGSEGEVGRGFSRGPFRS
jgi:hypothetical protein